MTYTLDKYKQQNEQYQKIINKQKVTIKTLRYSITQLINENELLMKRNKELESLYASTTMKSIPVPPPRSPYRNNNSDKSRPPLLNLVKSNHALQPCENQDDLFSPNTSSSSSSSTSTSSSDDDPLSPKHHNAFPLSPTSDHIQPSKSEPCTPAVLGTPRIDSLSEDTSIIDIQIKVIHYDIDKKTPFNDSYFLLAITRKETTQELWRVEKSYHDILALDTKLKEINPTLASRLKSLPDKSLFLSLSPSKRNERKAIIEEYMRHAISLNIDHPSLYKFLCTNKIHDIPRYLHNPNVIKQGYLSKKKRNFGGWKTRYFVLDHHNSLKYYEHKNGHFLGSIRLDACQIISDTQPESDQDHPNTFLLLEQKTNTTFTKHSFSASSLEDKQSWIKHIQSINDLSALSFTRRRSHYHKKPDTIDFSHDESMGRRKSSTAIPNPSFTLEERKQKNHRKTFWPIKMFGHHQESEEEERNGVFGIPLEEAVSKSRINDQSDLPAIVYRCIAYIEAKHGLIEEGIYRQSGSTLEVNALKKKFNDLGDVTLLEDGEFHDIHAVVGLLKMWLRELPENILTEAVLGDLMKKTHTMDKQSMLIELGNLVSSLPLANYTLLRFLCAHLIRVIENSDKNKMTLKNVSIIFSVTLGIPSSVFNMLLLEFDYIFWTNRCDDNQITEKTIKMYMDSMEDLSVDRSSRNSVHYQEKTPKEFMALERKLQVSDDVNEEEGNLSDGELEVAYFASRYNANSKTNNNH